MTIRIDHLTIDPRPDTWIRPQIEGEVDITLDETYRVDLLAMVRHILRERSDSNQIPVVIAAVQAPRTNQYGHDLFVEVEYHTRGYRAVYAGCRTEYGMTNVQCYMD